MFSVLGFLIPKELLIKVGAFVVIAVALWGHGYHTADNRWEKWYDKEVTRQSQINKSYYERGLSEAKRLQQEEQKDDDNLKQLEQEADSDPNANTTVLPRSSVQRLDRF